MSFFKEHLNIAPSQCLLRLLVLHLHKTGDMSASLSMSLDLCGE